MTDGVPLPEGFPPYIHTRHLSAADQAYCEENPTYAGRLQSLQELRVEMQHAQEVLAVGKRHRQKSKKQLEAWEHESRSIEDAFMKADDELAMLAECLLSWPVVWRHDEEVRFSQGRWMWPLPRYVASCGLLFRRTGFLADPQQVIACWRDTRTTGLLSDGHLRSRSLHGS